MNSPTYVLIKILFVIPFLIDMCYNVVSLLRMAKLFYISLRFERIVKIEDHSQLTLISSVFSVIGLNFQKGYPVQGSVRLQVQILVLLLKSCYQCKKKISSRCIFTLTTLINIGKQNIFNVILENDLWLLSFMLSYLF